MLIFEEENEDDLMAWWNPFSNRPIQVERDSGGNWNYTMFSSKSNYTQLTTDLKKMQMVFSNPAVLQVFALQCDLFSLGKIVDSEGNEVNTPLTQKLNNPNFFQTNRQFLWDFCFWNMLGNSYFYPSDKLINDSTQFYWLNSSCVEFPQKTTQQLDKLILSSQAYKKIQSLPIKYHYADGTTKNMTLKDVKPFFDLTNGTGNWYKGCSRLDALVKIVSNSESSLDAKNINLDYVQKFLVAGKHDPSKDFSGTPMRDNEKQSIESVMNSAKNIHAVKQMIDIKRFVESIKNLGIDEAFTESSFRIGKMYNIPRDVLEMHASSTYENQEKARMLHVSYTLQPKGDDMIQGISDYLGDTTGYKMTWDHLPFMRVFEKDNSIIRMTDARTFDTYVKNGASPKDVAAMLGVDLTFKNTSNGED